MTIKRGGTSEPISGTIYKREIPTKCPNCHYSYLGPRIYKDEELVSGQIPYDANQWKQCHHCGYLVAVHDIPQQGQLTTDIEPIKTKFSTAGKQDEHYKKPKHRRGFNERLDTKQGEIKDPEVKAALKKGAKLLSYNET